jgi:hypothetical protein
MQQEFTSTIGCCKICNTEHGSTAALHNYSGFSLVMSVCKMYERGPNKLCKIFNEYHVKADMLFADLQNVSQNLCAAKHA